MGFFSFDTLQKLWSVWELRGIILFSLLLQSFLILASPFRRKTANVVVAVSLWLAYLLADWAATFAVGLISHSQGDTSIHKTTSDLMTLWAPILINHLGGPDSITALALEDNELWQRHLLQLSSQLGATLYVFYKSIPDSELWTPTILMLLAGLIKYGERIYALYLASVNKFKESLLTEPDPGPNYAKLMEEYTMRIDARLPADIEHIIEPEIEFVFSKDVPTDKGRTDFEMVHDAYKWFTKFKGLVADLIYSKDDWRETRAYFTKRNPEQAFRIMEIELNFMYEVLYTKMPVIRSGVGYFFRLLCIILVVVSLCLWYSQDKSQFFRYDVNITYTLLGGAITLDVVSFFMLVFSDWSIAQIMSTSVGDDESQNDKSIQSKCRGLINRYLAISRRRWSDFSENDKTTLSKLFSGIFCFWRSGAKEGKTIPFVDLASRILNRRWSESIQQFNLVDYCVNVRNEKVEKLYELLGIKDLLDGNKYVCVRWFSESLRDSIFSELKVKSDKVEKPGDADKICKMRGEWVLQNTTLSNINHEFSWEDLKPWTTDVDYDESLILWHIATEICYNQEEKDAPRPNDSQTLDGQGDVEEQKDPKERVAQQEISKIVSDYMLYLLIRQPKIMTPVAGIGQFRFRDTCAEAMKFLKSLALDKQDKEKRIRSACSKLFEVSTDIPPKEAKGDRSKSVLFEGCRLAKELNKLQDDDKWMVIHKVWVEMLSYAATHCTGNAHAAQLSKGGQLITFVWLLMVHLGLGKQFLINEGNVRAKLVVGR